MSHQATTWAVAQKVGSPARKFVLMAICNYANDENEAWPSQKTIAKETEQSAKSVARHIEVLEEQGFFTRTERRRRDGGRSSDTFRLMITPEEQQEARDAFARRKMLGAEDTPPGQIVHGGDETDCRVGHGQNVGAPPTNCPGKNLKERTFLEGTTPIAPKGAEGDEKSKGWEKDPAYLAFLAEYGPSQAWPRHRGYRQWLKLAEPERKAAVAAIPAYRAVCAKERRKLTDPSAYLRGTFRNFEVRLTPRAPESEAVKALRLALGANYQGGVMVEHGSPQWAAWAAVAEEAQLPLRAKGYPARPFAGRPKAVTGRYMPSEWPPSRDGPDRQQQAAGG